MTVTVTTKNYSIYVKGKLFKVCKNKEEKDQALARLKQDKSLKPGDIKVSFNILVGK